MKLHIGGEQRREGWVVLNIRPMAAVDVVGDCTDLSMFRDGSFSEVYASHVLEHLGYDGALPKAIMEIHRVLTVQGVLWISVPDLDTLCRLFIHPQLSMQERFHVMRMMYGGRTNPYDVHLTGLNFEFLASYLHQAGFRLINRRESLGVFDDASNLRFRGTLISLNLEARK